MLAHLEYVPRVIIDVELEGQPMPFMRFLMFVGYNSLASKSTLCHVLLFNLGDYEKTRPT